MKRNRLQKNSILQRTLMSLVVLMTLSAHAQFEDVKEGENLYDDYEKTEQKRDVKKAVRRRKEDKSAKRIEKLSDLVDLAPFQDIAVIQRRFLPKTGRFEVSGLGLVSTNNAFFNNIGFSGRFGYYFSEKYGLEANYIYLSSAERAITENLKDKQSISTRSLVVPKGFMGINFKWSPVYGKLALFNKRIMPFDFYVAPGLGMAQTENGNSMAFSIGAGQLIALTKAWAFRWDFTWNFYQATVEQNGQEIDQQHNDLFLTFGISGFFPEATYR